MKFNTILLSVAAIMLLSFCPQAGNSQEVPIDTTGTQRDSLNAQRDSLETQRDSLNAQRDSLSLQGSFPEVRRDSLGFQLNDSTITIIKHVYGHDSIRFLSVHDDENTGTEAALEFMNEHGGSLVELEYGGERNIKFNLKSSVDKCIFDPNGMFTDTGAHRTLDKHARVTPESVKAIRSLGEKVLETYNYDSLGYVITLHNNTEGLYSIRYYLPGKTLETAASEVHINPELDIDDFVFVTEPYFFEYLKKKDVNVVLQSPDAPNDGSLSVYAAMQGVPYVNIEVQDGHLAEHRELIDIVAGMMKEFLLKNP